MRALLQRVSSASVEIDGQIKSKIGTGLLILLGVEGDDTKQDIEWLAKKTAQMRIFSDSEGLMNRSCADAEGSFLVVSQFTLHASTKKGARPSFIRAARPQQAVPLYELFCQKLAAESGCSVQTGEFGADMKVGLVNDGPVTIWLDTKAKE